MNKLIIIFIFILSSCTNEKMVAKEGRPLTIQVLEEKKEDICQGKFLIDILEKNCPLDKAKEIISKSSYKKVFMTKTNFKGMNPLLWSLKSNNLEFFQYLFFELEKLKEENEVLISDSELSLILKKEHVEFVKFLIRSDYEYFYRLFVDVNQTKLKMIIHLLKGMNINVNSGRNRGLGETDYPLLWASKISTKKLNKEEKKLVLEVANLLIEQNSLIDRVDENDPTMRTPLHYASIFGNAEVAEAILNTNRVNIEVLDATHQGAIHLATLSNSVEVLNLLLKYPFNKGSIHQDTKSPLFMAIRKGHLEIFKALLNQIEDKELKSLNIGSKSLLHNCAYYGRVNMIKVLISRGPIFNFNQLDSLKRTPLDLANSGKKLMQSGRISFNRGTLDQYEKVIELIKLNGGKEGPLF